MTPEQERQARRMAIDEAWTREQMYLDEQAEMLADARDQDDARGEVRDAGHLSDAR